MMRLALCLLFLNVLAIAGCSPQESSSARSAGPVITKTTDAGPIAPGVVELKSASATRDENNVIRFEVSYLFTSGSPVKTYLCNVTFPGSDQVGIRPLESFELKPEGTFKMGIEVGENKVDAFELTFSEADSPDRGYTVISNTLVGQVAEKSTTPAGTAPN
jgi:hypothetical protein